MTSQQSIEEGLGVILSAAACFFARVVSVCWNGVTITVPIIRGRVCIEASIVRLEAFGIGTGRVA